MSDETTHRYRAFISYSQLDRDHAKRLHSALETYRVPKGTEAALPQNRRLGRFFRDDDEMGASTDLGASLREALESSENLIVICSPHAARSEWVNAEILHFKSLGRGGRIFAVIADGIPNADDPALNCFPPALRFEAPGEELLAERPAEPLGIDLRKEPLSRSRLRLAAGMLGISFDSLWQRDKRRTMKRRLIGAFAALLLGSVIAFLGTRWLTERGNVHAQRIDRTLGTVRNDLASERVKDALVELEALYEEGERGAVEDVMKTSLSWISTPEELLKEIKPPALVTNGPQLFFLASDASRHVLNIHEPSRRILSSNKRWLLIFGADEIVALNVADGRELSRISSNKITWEGHTFETAGGLLLVGGRFYGLTNGTLNDSLLVFSPQRQALSLFNLRDHWQDDEKSPRFISPLAVSPGCRSFGVSRERLESGAEMSLLPADVVTFSASSNGLEPTPVPDELTDWNKANMFDEFDTEAVAGGAGSFVNAGCKEPGSDSADFGSKHPLTALIPSVGLGTAWEPEKRWKVIGKAKKQGGDGGIGAETDENGPCTEARPCTIQDPVNADNTEFLGIGQPTDLGRPRGVARDDRSFDSVSNEKVHVFEGGNAVHIMDWCRKLNSKGVCLEEGSAFDPSALLQDQLTEMDLRSTTGRFIFYPQGSVAGFRLYDLLTMRNVTPPGAELVASTHWADFSADDKRLFLTMNGRLLVFEPPADGSHWQRVSDGGSVQIPALTGNKDDRVSGLLTLDDNNLIVVRSSGVISRFDWRTGQESWRRTITNAGEIMRAVPSRNRRFVLIIGRGGGRLLDTNDGLVLSGVLVPPTAMDGSTDMLECFQESFVTDAGLVEVSCGKNEYRREQIAFQGDVRSRLRQILSSEAPAGSK